MAEYTNCYIAFLDLLGFKKKVEKLTCDDILNIYSNIKIHITALHRYKENGWKELIDSNDLASLKIKVMSDSICFYIDSSIENAFLMLASACITFQNKLLAMEEPVLVRGAVVKGNIYVDKDKDITFGPGLSKAYMLEEHSAKNPRIIFPMCIAEEAIKESTAPFADIITKFIFTDYDGYGVFNYFSLLNGNQDDKNLLERFTNHIYMVLNTTTDDSIREKYLYLAQRIPNDPKSQRPVFAGKKPPIT